MTVRFEFRPDGYVRIRTWEACEGRERYVYEHQLVAIADGADPYKVFSDGRFHVHHRNRIRCDNRRENLELVDGDEHGEYHLHGRKMNERGASA
jgi:hypothetical protein